MLRPRQHFSNFADFICLTLENLIKKVEGKRSFKENVARH